MVSLIKYNTIPHQQFRYRRMLLHLSTSQERADQRQYSTRQSSLLNLGRHFAIEQDHWPKLSARIDEIMACQLTLMPVECPLAAERDAQRIAALLLARRWVTLTAPEPVSKTAIPAADTASVTNAPDASTSLRWHCTGPVCRR